MRQTTGPDSGRDCRGARARLAAVGLIVASSLGPCLCRAEPLAKGQPLRAALEELESRGLRVIYSSALVTEEMRLANPPSAEDPLEILAEILSPHGLAAEPASGERLLVVRGAVSTPAEQAVGAVRGRVVDLAGQPMSRVEIAVEGSEFRALTSEDGRFEISGVATGRHAVVARTDGYLVERRERVPVESHRAGELSFRMTPLVTPIAEVVIVSSVELLSEEPNPGISLDRETISRLPHFGDDLYRVFATLPSASSGDFSARFNLRGGLHDEILVLIDGVELVEPFHLKDFQGALSVLDPQVLGGAELMPGSFPAEYGDRMTGVLDLRTRRLADRRTELGLSFSNLWAGSSGTFAAGRGGWVASLRRGYLDLLLDLAVEDDEGFDPSIRYWDGFGKIDLDPSPRDVLGFGLLTARDDMLYQEIEPWERTKAETSYGNDYLWLRHRRLLGSRAFFETRLSSGTVARDRLILSDDDGGRVHIGDLRQTEILDLVHSWSLQAGDHHLLRWGLEARRTAARYDYANDLVLDDSLPDPRFPPTASATSFAGRFEGDHVALHFSDRLRLGKGLTLELGARYDRQSLTHEDQLSPRLNVVWDLGRVGALRAGWGHFYQSHRPHELEPEYGETRFHPAQRAENRTLGYERALPFGRLRIEAYSRRVSDPRPRHETLFDPFRPAPEAAADWIRIAPDRARAKGVELFLGGRRRGGTDWWLSYTHSLVEDQVDGVWTKRSVDQPHAITACVTSRPGDSWSITALWTYHTGWPATAVTAWSEVAPDWQQVIHYEIGPFYGERHPSYARVDVRTSRTTRLRRGTFTFFVDIRNLFDRANVRGLAIGDPEIQYRSPEYSTVSFPPERWFGIMPSLGLSWGF